jgi:hypothetical protein
MTQAGENRGQVSVTSLVILFPEYDRLRPQISFRKRNKSFVLVFILFVFCIEGSFHEAMLFTKAKVKLP